MKNILALINLSAGAERLSKLAYKVAQQCNANLLLCSFFELPVLQNFTLANDSNSDWLTDEQPHLTIEKLVDEVRKEFYAINSDNYKPEITCLKDESFNSDKVRAIISANDVDMIVTGITDILDLNTSGLLTMINRATCPVFVIPDGVSFDRLSAGTYVTDLRYCDLKVLSYLKELDAKIFVTHISMNGIPDMEDGYAQSLLSDFATSVKYNKLFLRNIKGFDRKRDLEKITDMEKIQFMTIVNEKHGLLERFLSDTVVNRRSYHNLPVLIMPYLNWYK